MQRSLYYIRVLRREYVIYENFIRLSFLPKNECKIPQAFYIDVVKYIFMQSHTFSIDYEMLLNITRYNFSKKEKHKE